MWSVGSVVVVGMLVVGVYFYYRWYLAQYSIIKDSNSDTMLIDTSKAPDYRNSGINDLGIRNNNPGNLRPNGDSWRGMSGTNGGFLTFCNLWYGIRAGVINITSLIKTYHTIEGYISAYAPPSENDTEAYIASVCGQTGLARNETVALNHANLAKLARAHFNIENGAGLSAQYIMDEDIRSGILMIVDGFNKPIYPVA